MSARPGGSDCLTVGRGSCKQLISKSLFFVCRWQACRFSHKQGESEVETVKATTDSERRKSRHSSPTSDWCCTLELRNVRLMAACHCVTLSRIQRELDVKEPQAAVKGALCCCSNVSDTNIGKRLFEPHRKYLSVQTFPPGRWGGKCCYWLSSRKGRLNLKVQIALHSWFIVTLTHTSTLFI